MLKLHGLEISGNTYKAQLLLSFLNIEYQLFPIDIKNKQHKSPEFLRLNPRGEFPVLEDKENIIWDSQAILIYLACAYGDKHWFPDRALEMATIAQWLSVANGDIFNSLAKARSILKLSYPGDLQDCQLKGKSVLIMIEQHLASRQAKGLDWIATEMPSIADIACYPYIALCEEGSISLNNYKSIHNWMNNIQNMSGYISMPGITKPSAHET